MGKDKTNKYELLGTLGRGGFGNVYKAVSDDGSLVAIKELNPYLLDSPSVVEKFFHEAGILSKLNHQNICRLIEFFSENSSYIIVMEFIDGVDLKGLMYQVPDNRLPFKHAINIASQCLEAFQYAYEEGVLHSDIKPANIMIDKNGKSIITDFGTAMIIGDASQFQITRILSHAYSPPERFNQAEKVDIRSDIYSLGMVFYELFTGKKPFDTTIRSEIESWHRNEMPVPVSRLNSSIPHKITAAINTALEKKQEYRFKDFLEFRNAMGFEDYNEI